MPTLLFNFAYKARGLNWSVDSMMHALYISRHGRHIQTITKHVLLLIMSRGFKTARKRLCDGIKLRFITLSLSMTNG